MIKTSYFEVPRLGWEAGQRGTPLSHTFFDARSIPKLREGKEFAGEKDEVARLSGLVDKYRGLIQRQHGLIERAGLLSKEDRADNAAEQAFDAYGLKEIV